MTRASPRHKNDGPTQLRRREDDDRKQPMQVHYRPTRDGDDDEGAGEATLSFSYQFLYSVATNR